LIVRSSQPTTVKWKGYTTMNQDNVIELKKPEPFIDDQISAIIRQGARKLLAQALEWRSSSLSASMSI
jgi:hypothetical protein